jgi:hypothetical protein
VIERRTVKIGRSREAIDAAIEMWEGLACVSRGENDDPETVRRWRYVCGKNINLLVAFRSRVAHAVGRMAEKNAGPWNEYAKEVGRLRLDLAKRDDSGRPMMTVSSEDGERHYVYTEPNAARLDDGERTLQVKHAAAIAAQRKIEAEAKAYCAREEAVALCAFPWDQVPERISGGYVVAIVELLVGAPADLLHDPEPSAAPRKNWGRFRLANLRDWFKSRSARLEPQQIEHD